MQTTLHHIPL